MGLQSAQAELDPPMLHYLLSDLHVKLKAVLAAEKSVPFFALRQTAKAKLPAVSKEELLPYLTELVGALKIHLQSMADHQSEDGCREQNMYLILQCLKLIFQYKDVSTSDGDSDKKLLSQRLKAIADRKDMQEGVDEAVDQEYIDRAISISIECFSALSTQMRNLQHASALVELLEVLATHHSDSKTVMATGSNAALKFLLNAPSEEMIADFDKTSLVALLHKHVVLASPPILALQSVVSTHMMPWVRQGYDAENGIPILNQQTLPSFFKVCMDELTDIVCECVSLLKKAGADPEQSDTAAAVVSDVQTCASVFYHLMEIIKSVVGKAMQESKSGKIKLHRDHREILAVALKKGNTVIGCLLQMIPLFHKILIKSKDVLLKLFKTFQQSTRLMHIVCGHAKTAQDISLTKLVPKVKKSLEVLLLKVKEMLDANKCHRAFWVGSLKHKSLDGSECSSQMLLDQEEDEDGVSSHEEDDEQKDDEVEQ